MTTAILLQWLGAVSVALTFASVLALALRRPARRVFGAGAAYWIWLAVPAAIVATLLPESQRVSGTLPALLPPVLVGGAATVGPAARAGLGADALLAAWLAGVAVLVVVFARQQLRLQRGLQPRASNAGVGAARDRSGRFGPAVVGLLRPRIVLPDDFEQRYDAAERALIIAHERMHVRRGDAAANALAAALRSLFWFNPLIHFCARRFALDQELACDAAVLRESNGARRAYAQAMLKTQLTDLGLPVGCHWQSSQPLKERILMLKQTPPSNHRRALGRALVGALAAGFALAAYAAQPKHAPATSAAHEETPASYAALKRPKYPLAAIAAREEGLVVLEVLIGADGLVKETRVVPTQPLASQALQLAAAEGVKTWRFNAARRDGKAVETWARVPITFSLDERDSAKQYEGDDALDTIGVSGKQ